MLGVLSNDGLLDIVNLGAEKSLEEKRAITHQAFIFSEGVSDLLESLEGEMISVEMSELLNNYRISAINETARLLRKLGIGSVITVREYEQTRLGNYHKIVKEYGLSRVPKVFSSVRKAMSGTPRAPIAEHVAILLQSMIPILDDHIAVPLEMSSRKYSDLLIIEAATEADRQHIRRVKREMLGSVKQAYESLNVDSPIRAILAPVIPFIDSAEKLATKEKSDPDFEQAVHEAFNHIEQLMANLSNFQASDQERIAKAILTILTAAVPIDALPQEMAWLFTRKLYEVEAILESAVTTWSQWYSIIQAAQGEQGTDDQNRNIARALLAHALSPFRTEATDQEMIASRLNSFFETVASAVTDPNASETELVEKAKELLSVLDTQEISHMYQWSVPPSTGDEADDELFEIDEEALDRLLEIDEEALERFLSDEEDSGFTHTTFLETEFPRVRYPEAQQRAPIVPTQDYEEGILRFIFHTHVETARQSQRDLLDERDEQANRNNRTRLMTRTTSDIRQVGYGGILNSIVNTNGLMFHPDIIEKLIAVKRDETSTNTDIEVVLFPSEDIIKPSPTDAEPIDAVGIRVEENRKGVRLVGSPMAIYSLLVMGIPPKITRVQDVGARGGEYHFDGQRFQASDTPIRNGIQVETYRVDTTTEWHINLPLIANTINAIRSVLSDIRDDDYLAAPLALLGSISPNEDVSKGGILANLVMFFNELASSIRSSETNTSLDASYKLIEIFANAIRTPSTPQEKRLAFILDNTYITQEITKEDGSGTQYEIMSLRSILLSKIRNIIVPYTRTDLADKPSTEEEHTNAINILPNLLENLELNRGAVREITEKQIIQVATEIVWSLATLPLMVVLASAATTATQMISNGLPLKSLERGSVGGAIKPLIRAMKGADIIELSTALAFKVENAAPYLDVREELDRKHVRIVLANGQPLPHEKDGDTHIYKMDDDRPKLVFSSELGRRGAFARKANEYGDKRYEIPVAILPTEARLSVIVTAESVAREQYEKRRADGVANTKTDLNSSLGKYGLTLHGIRYGLIIKNLAITGSPQNRYTAKKDEDIITAPVILSFELHAPSYPRDWENPLKEDDTLLKATLRRIYNQTKYAFLEPIITIQGALLRTFQKREGRVFAKEWLLHHIGDKSSLYTETSPASSKVGAWLYNTGYSLTSALMIAAAYSRYSINNDPGFSVMAIFSLGPIVGTAILLSRSRKLKARFKNTMRAVLRRQATLKTLLYDTFKRIDTIIKENPQQVHNTTEIIRTVRDAIRNIPMLPSPSETGDKGFAGEVVPELFIENNSAFASKFGIKSELIPDDPTRSEIGRTLRTNIPKLYSQAAFPITGYLLQPEQGDLRTESYEKATWLLADTVRRKVHALYSREGTENDILSTEDQVFLSQLITVNLMLKAFTDKHVKMTGTNLTTDTANYVRYILNILRNEEELTTYIKTVLNKLSPHGHDVMVDRRRKTIKSLALYKNLPALYVHHLIEALPDANGNRGAYSEYEILYGLTRLDHYTDSIHHNIVYHDREAFHKLLHTILLGREVATFAHVRDRHVEHPTLRYQYVISSQMGTLAPRTPPSFIANITRVMRDLIASFTDPFATLTNIGLNYLLASSPLNYSRDQLMRLRELPSYLANSLINNKTLAIMLFGLPFIAPIAAHSMNISLDDISRAVPAMLASFPLKLAALIALGRIAVSAARTSMPSMGLIFSAMRNKIGEIAAIDNMRDLLLSRVKPAFVDYETYSPEEFTESLKDKAENTPSIIDSIETSLAHTFLQVIPQGVIREKLKNYYRAQGMQGEEIEQRVNSIPSPEVALLEINKSTSLEWFLDDLGLKNPEVRIFKEGEILVVGNNRTGIKTKAGRETEGETEENRDDTSQIVMSLIKAALNNANRYPHLQNIVNALASETVGDKFLIKLTDISIRGMNEITLQEVINLIEDIYTGRFIFNGVQDDFASILNRISHDQEQPNGTEIAIEAYNLTVDALHTLLKHIITHISKDALETIETQLGGAIYLMQSGHTPSERYVLRNILLSQLSAFGTPLKVLLETIKQKPNPDERPQTLSGIASRLLEILERHYPLHMEGDPNRAGDRDRILEDILHAFEQRITGDEPFDQMVMKAINQTSEASALERTKRTEGSGETIDRITKILLAMRIRRDNDQIFSIEIRPDQAIPDLRLTTESEGLLVEAIVAAKGSVDNIATELINLFKLGLGEQGNDINDNNALRQFINKLHLIILRSNTRETDNTGNRQVNEPESRRTLRTALDDVNMEKDAKLKEIEKYLSVMIAQLTKTRIDSYAWFQPTHKDSIKAKLDTLTEEGNTGELIRFASGIVGEDELFVVLATMLAQIRHLRIALTMASQAESRIRPQNADNEPVSDEEERKVLFLFESALMKHSLESFMYDTARLRSMSSTINEKTKLVMGSEERLNPNITLPEINMLIRNINQHLSDYLTYEKVLPSSHLGLLLSEAMKHTDRSDLTLIKNIDEIISETNLLMLSDGVLEDIRNAQNKQRMQVNAPVSINDSTRQKREMLSYIRNLSEMVGAYVGLMVLQAPRLIALRSAVAHRLFSAMLLAPGFAITGLYETINAAKNIAILSWMQAKRSKNLASRSLRILRPTTTLLRSYLPIALVTFGLWALGLWTMLTGSTPVLETPFLGTKIIASTNPKNEFTFGDIQLITENGIHINVSAPRTADVIAQLALLSSLPFTYGGVQDIDNTLSEIVLGPFTSVTKSRTVVGHTLVTGFNQLLTNHFLGKPRFEPVRPAIAWLDTNETIAPNWLERIINTAYVASFPIYYVSSFAESGFKGGFTQNVLFTTDHYGLALLNTAMQAVGIEGRVDYNQDQIDLPFALAPTLKINRYPTAITNQYMNEIAYDYKDNILLGAVMSNSAASYRIGRDLSLQPKPQSIYKEALDLVNASSIESKLAPRINTQAVRQQVRNITKDAQLALTLATIIAADYDNRKILREEYIGGAKDTAYLQDTNVLGKALAPLVNSFPDIFHSRNQIEKYTSFLNGVAVGDKISLDRNLATERLRTWSELKGVGYAMSANPIIKGNIVLGSVASLLQVPISSLSPRVDIATLTPYSEIFFTSIYTATRAEQLYDILLNMNMRESDARLLPTIRVNTQSDSITAEDVTELKKRIRDAGMLLKGGVYNGQQYAVAPIRVEPIVPEPQAVINQTGETIPLDKSILGLALFKDDKLFVFYTDPLTKTLRMQKSKDDFMDGLTLLRQAAFATARESILYEVLPATTSSTARYAHPFIPVAFNRNDAHIILNQTLEKVFRDERGAPVTTTGERYKDEIMQKPIIQDPFKPTNMEMHIVARGINYWQTRMLTSQPLRVDDRNAIERIINQTVALLREEATLTIDHLERAKQRVTDTVLLSQEEKTIVLKTIDATISDLRGYLHHITRFQSNRDKLSETIENMQRLLTATSTRSEEWSLALGVDMYLTADYLTYKERRGIKTTVVGYRVAKNRRIPQEIKILMPYNNLHSIVSAAAYYQINVTGEPLLSGLLSNEEIPVLGKIPTPKTSTIFP